jgi:secretion/DNA translocation related TadE-like protein
VLAVVFLGLLVAVAAGVATVGAAVVDQRRVEAAADLGALAGASALQQGRAGCPAAASVVERNGGRVDSCSEQGQDVVVTAARGTRHVLGLSWTVTSTARAGPAGVDGPGRLAIPPGVAGAAPTRGPGGLRTRMVQ